MINTKKQALAIVGGLSKPSKMPGFAYGLPAWECKTGGKLAQVIGSICYNCYARKGSYTMYPAVKQAQYKRLKSLDDIRWTSAMVKLITGQEFFRWHDAGDLQGLWHLEKIVTVAKKTPDTNHWLPTKEKKIINDFLKSGKTFPNNLTVRLSMPMVDMAPRGNFPYTSTVYSKDGHAYGYKCPAYQQGGECRDCRACWNKGITNVSYSQH